MSENQDKYIVRPIEKRDNEQISKIIKTVMTEFGAVGCGYSIEDTEVDNMFDAYGVRAKYFVVEKDGRILGGSGVAQLLNGDADTCELKKMYFLNELRGKGFGEKLLNLCLKAAKELGYKKCYLETLTQMENAQRLYEKHGFKKLERPMGDTGHFKCNCWYVREV
ncbi:MAG TPA: GNAT family N-acetyltransferase [Ignavibacteria bacterium]|nr:GNAT family N-acetyltransferase [Ignavibacteria bacterium]